jgi:hypothetical protein
MPVLLYHASVHVLCYSTIRVPLLQYLYYCLTWSICTRAASPVTPTEVPLMAEMEQASRVKQPESTPTQHPAPVLLLNASSASRVRCVCVYVCVCVCVCTHTRTHKHARTHTLSHTHTPHALKFPLRTQTYTHTFTHADARTETHTNLHTYIHTCGRSHRNTHTCGTHASTPTRLHPLAPAHELVLLSSLSFFLSFFLSLSLSRSRSVSSPSYPHNGLLRF